MRTGLIAEVVGTAIGEAATQLRPDFRDALRSASIVERSPRGKRIIGQLLENAEIAERERLPLCQDTGSVWVWVELGVAECLEGDLQGDIDRAVAEAYLANGLRMSMVRDSYSLRANSGDNTPAFVDLTQKPGSGARVHVMLKGGGSDNSSQIAMLDPSAGEEGIAEFLVRALKDKASGACPPLLIGVGVGGTFDTVGKYAKRALLRRIGEPAVSESAEALEQRLLEVANATGIGPAGLGGDTTAVAVNVVTAASHIAALPVAVNMGCCAVRSVTVDVD